MESRRIMEFLTDKSLLITGSTGFLAKVFVEKLLRVQPGVKRLYLLIRAVDAASAKQRMQNEIVSRELFKVLKETHGGGFESFVADKLFPVVGDVAEQNLGIRDSDLLQFLFKEVEIVVNVAATTDFYERYDVALRINTIGAKNALQFAQNCKRLQLLLHVSTAFVQSGERKGVVIEKKLEMGETPERKNPNSRTYLDIEEEVRLVDSKKREVQAMSQQEQKAALINLGRKRAEYFGWRNTYVFTKAMGEMLLGHLRGDTPLLILRPAIISSIYRDPLPSWIEGVRTIDSLIVGYAKGKLPCFLGDPEMIVDLIPVDMVVNVMIVTMVIHSGRRSEFIYHVGSSMRHPLTYAAMFQYVNDYFSEDSSTRFRNNNEQGERRIKARRKLRLLRSFLSFRVYMMIRYKLPFEVMHLLSNLLWSGLLSSSRYKQLGRIYSYTELLFDLYRPFVFSMEPFDDFNLERLRKRMREDEEEDQEEDADEGEMECNHIERFDLDPRNVGDWKNYFCNIHIPGLLRAAL